MENQLITIKLNPFKRMIVIKSTDGAQYAQESFDSVEIDDPGIAIYFCEGSLLSYLRAESVLDGRDEELWKIACIY